MVKWCFIFRKGTKKVVCRKSINYLQQKLSFLTLNLLLTNCKIKSYIVDVINYLLYNALFCVFYRGLIIYLYFYIERMSFMEKIINWLRIVLAEEKSSKLTLNVLK